MAPGEEAGRGAIIYAIDLWRRLVRIEGRGAATGHVVEVAGDQHETVDTSGRGQTRVANVLLAFGEELAPEFGDLPADRKQAVAESEIDF